MDLDNPLAWRGGGAPLLVVVEFEMAYAHLRRQRGHGAEDYDSVATEVAVESRGLNMPDPATIHIIVDAVREVTAEI